MAELKTKPTEQSVTEFLNKVSDKTRRDDCFTVLEMMRAVTGEEPKMWGSSIVGFGRYRYKYDSGREGEAMITGFSPRKGDLTLYLSWGFDGARELMDRLGKFKTGKVCLYIKKLDDVDRRVLAQIISKAVKKMSAQRIKE